MTIPVRRILFPHDFSEVGHALLPFADELARELDAELHLLHALHYPGLLDTDLASEEADLGATFDLLQARARESLALAAARVGSGEHGRVPLWHVAIHRPPAAAILGYAQQHGIDLVIMATHGRRGIGRLVLGSVTSEVVRASRVPTLVLRDPARAKVWSRLERILVPHDTSEHSQRALTLAKAIAAWSGATIELLHVLPDPVMPAFYGTAVTAIYDPQRGPLREEALRELERLFVAAPGDPVASRCHVRHGDPSREILAAAVEEQVDLVLLSSQGLTGLDRLLLGSVAERLVRGCEVPVLVVPAAASDAGEPSSTANPPGPGQAGSDDGRTR
jgi:nucleotide-binding universal stress UspA family protein